MTRWPAALLIGLLALPAPPARAATCNAVEIRFSPGVERLQIVVWIEDTAGTVIATPYITRATGQFGLANRPGAALLKTDFKWPYGRRDMVMPIWAHRRNKHYPKVTMGGVCGNSPTTLCPDNTPCAGQCSDTTIAYHERVSSNEPYYCAPGRTLDAVTCASPSTLSKGAYAPAPAFSLYPPRADVTAYYSTRDSTDLKDFPVQNDLVAVSAATPIAGTSVFPPPSWIPQNLPDGDYVAYVELSQESDFNASHDHPNQTDTESSWDWVGHKFLGQPSVVYKVPFHYGPTPSSAVATQYAGYSTWDGSDGILHPPDATITSNVIGSGAGRLIDVNDGMDVYRVKVVVGPCNVTPPDGGTPGTDGGTPTCVAPDPVNNLELTPAPNSLKVTFAPPPGGVAPERFQVRYREGTAAIAGETFDLQVAGPTVAPGAAGARLATELLGLQGNYSYAVAVRGVAACGKPSAVASQIATTQGPKFAVLHGCFIATAAYGSSMARSLDTLRRFRDEKLLSNPAGRLATAVYYALSPPLAHAIASDDALRALARAALRPLVTLISN
jgi:hypothetical protein